MNVPAAYGIFSHETAIPDVLHTLTAAGFGKEDICMMFSPAHPIASTVREASIFSTDRAAAGVIGWLSELGAVVIPTVGFFIRSQKFFRALIVDTPASAFCGHNTTLSNLGLPDFDAERYEDQLQTSGVLVYVSCPENKKHSWALELLRQNGARESATLERDALATAASA